MIRVKRIYDPPVKTDDMRVLVDRVWPRGLAKEKAQIDLWLKDVAPSPALRKWFAHDPAKWLEFKSRYFRELDSNPAAVEDLAAEAKRRRVTLLFGAREERYNNAAALKEYIETAAGRNRKK